MNIHEHREAVNSGHELLQLSSEPRCSVGPKYRKYLYTLTTPCHRTLNFAVVIARNNNSFYYAIWWTSHRQRRQQRRVRPGYPLVELFPARPCPESLQSATRLDCKYLLRDVLLYTGSSSLASSGNSCNHNVQQTV